MAQFGHSNFFFKNNFDLYLQTLMSFEDFGFGDNLLRGIFTYGWEQPSELQLRVIPTMVSGKDMVVQAPSGVGKTGCFGLGMLQHCLQRPCNGLIMCTSRELARQTCGVLQELSKFVPSINIVLLSGGTRRADNIKGMASTELFIAVGTPGRTLDILSTHQYQSRTIADVVLDEADELLGSPGFVDTSRQIFSLLPKDARLGVFSATMPDSVITLAQSLQKNPTVLTIQDPRQLTLAGIKQYYCWCKVNMEKLKMIEFMYQHWSISAAVIFCSSRNGVDWVSDQLSSRGFSVTRLHSDMSNDQRVRAMKDFRSGSTRVMVATQVIARGLDVQSVQLVLQFDLVTDVNVYLHAVGRCGRYGRKGVNVCFLKDTDTPVYSDLCQHYGIDSVELPQEMIIPEISQI
jgi:superfamily II DNA/RNA helicase